MYTRYQGRTTARICVLLNVHGGGFTFESGSLTESIPMANLIHTRVVSVLYRLTPEHPYPAQLDDAVAVYRELLKTYRPEHIVIYGTSAGAILTREIAVGLRQLGLPEPAALEIFSGTGDLSMSGDTQALFTLNGLSGVPAMPDSKPILDKYLAGHDPKDPSVSPIYADLHGFPPTLFISSERNALLSGTINLHRAFLRAGVDARLIVFDGLAHTLWNEVELPESCEAYGYMAAFLCRILQWHDSGTKPPNGHWN
ncbi:MAG: alpha/beta hydrolase fold domain-containing protein [Janthinobacterium lividum]